MSTIVLLGSDGQLGTALQTELKQRGMDYLPLDLPVFDLNIPQTLDRILADRDVEVVINCAAYTNVPKAEEDVATAMQINASALKPLSDLCSHRNVLLVHISTDYVFDGSKGSAYFENDIPNPVNVYGFSKLMGEMLVKRYAKDYVIVRTAGLYGQSALNSDNIVEKLIRLGQTHDKLKMVTDEVTSPTYAVDLASQIMVILEKGIRGIVHASSNGQCNWLEFGQCIFENLELDVSLEPVPSSFFNKNLQKPLYSVMQNNVLQDMSCDRMPEWRESLIAYLKSKKTHGAC